MKTFLQFRAILSERSEAPHAEHQEQSIRKVGCYASQHKATFLPSPINCMSHTLQNNAGNSVRLLPIAMYRAIAATKLRNIRTYFITAGSFLSIIATTLGGRGGQAPNSFHGNCSLYPNIRQRGMCGPHVTKPLPLMVIRDLICVFRKIRIIP